MRFIVIGGAFMTVVGVAFLVALAIQSGLLGPTGRVVLAYLLSAALFGAGLKVRNNSIAFKGLTLSGIYGALGTTLTVVLALRWWPATLGAAILLAIIAGSAYWTTRLRENQLLTFIAGGSAVAAVVLATTPANPNATLTLILLILVPIALVACSVPAANFPTRATGFVLAALLIQILAGPGNTPALGTVGYILACAFVAGSVFVTLEWPTTPQGSTASGGDIALGAIAPLLFLLLAAGLGPRSLGALAVPLIALVAVAIASSYQHPRAQIAYHACLIGVAVGAIYLRDVLGTASPSIANALILAGFLLFVYLLAPSVRYFLVWLAWAGTIITLCANLLPALMGIRSDNFASPKALAISLISLLFLIAITARLARRHAPFSLASSFVIGAIALWMSSLAIVGIGTFLGSLGGHDIGTYMGFFWSHAVLSLCWIAIASWLMSSPRPMARRYSLAVGVALAAAGVTKLLLFDMALIGGLARATAFIGAGLLLLYVAVKRNKVLKAAGDLAEHPAAPEDQENLAEAPASPINLADPSHPADPADPA